MSMSLSTSLKKCFLCLIETNHVENAKENSGQGHPEELEPILESFCKFLDLEDAGLNIEFSKMLVFCSTCQDILTRIHIIQNNLSQIHRHLFESKQFISQIILENYGNGSHNQAKESDYYDHDEHEVLVPISNVHEGKFIKTEYSDLHSGMNDNEEFEYETVHQNNEEFFIPTFDFSTIGLAPVPVEESIQNVYVEPINEHLKDKSVGCVECKAEFSNSKILIKHMLIRHPSKVTKCSSCGKYYPNYKINVHGQSCKGRSLRHEISVVPIVDKTVTGSSCASESEQIVCKGIVKKSKVKKSDNFDKKTSGSIHGRKRKKTKEVQIFPLFTVDRNDEVEPPKRPKPKMLNNTCLKKEKEFQNNVIVKQELLDLDGQVEVPNRVLNQMDWNIEEEVDPIHVNEPLFQMETFIDSTTKSNSQEIVISNGSLIEIVPNIQNILNMNSTEESQGEEDPLLGV